MIERIIENWLTKASERSYQKPFCYMLAKQGFRIIHLTRHNEWEFGKDILAISPNNEICAYQLKSKPKIKLSDWRNELSKQIFDLVNLPVEHPSAPETGKWHRSFLVVNGDFEESVSEAINKFNRAQETAGYKDRKLETITYGEMFAFAQELSKDLFPSELQNIKLLLELYLLDGNLILPREKYVQIFEEILETNSNKKISTNECIRRLNSAALVCSLALSNFSKEKNFVAEIEGWVIYLTCAFASIEKNKLKKTDWKNIVEIAFSIIENTLEELYEEVKSRENVLEGHPKSIMYDTVIIRQRVTYIIGFLSVRHLCKQEFNNPAFNNFLAKYDGKIEMISEYEFPLLFAYFLFLKKVNKTKATELLKSIMNTVILLNAPETPYFLPNPYYSTLHIMLLRLGNPEYRIKETFKGNSYIIKSLLNLMVNLNEREYLNFLWNKISKIWVTEFYPENPVQYLKWKSQFGVYNSYALKETESWAKLKEEMNNIGEEDLPIYFKEYPIFGLLFFVVYPHRVNEKLTKLLDSIF